MKRMLIITITITLCAATDATTSGGTGENLILVKQLVEQVVNLMPPEWLLCVSDCMEHGNYTRWIGSPEFMRLEKEAAGNWEAVMENVAEIAPSGFHQFILFVSLQSLPQKDYFLCLDKLAYLCMDNTVDKEVFIWVISHYEGNTKPRHRLSLNHKDPVVAGILRKAKVINPEMSDYYDRQLSGEIKKEITSFWYEDPNDPESTHALGMRILKALAAGIAVTSCGIITAWWYIRKRKGKPKAG